MLSNYTGYFSTSELHMGIYCPIFVQKGRVPRKDKDNTQQAVFYDNNQTFEKNQTKCNVFLFNYISLNI